MTEQIYDLLVIGGGINGAGIARDAAGRGLKVLLVEQNDLASGTSSASTKLVHGGLRYLEYYEFRMVREALKERETLLTIAPHVIRPLDFVLPHDGTRPGWMIRAGLFLYDHLARRRVLKGSKSLPLRTHFAGAPLADPPALGFQYSDAWADDARLVVLNVLDAKERGADIQTETKCIELKSDAKGWLATLQNDTQSVVRARAVINASGPWVESVLKTAGTDSTAPRTRLVKGSHIIVKKAFEGAQAYILQQPDKRVVFAIPYENDFTLVGTTEENFTGDPSQAAISEAEKTYLCEAFNRSFKNKISNADILHSYSGVRPLFEDGSASATSASRDYKLHHHKEFAAPMISVYGGKLTTYRAVAEEAVSKIMVLMGRDPKIAWTGGTPLPGGEFGDFDHFLARQKAKYGWLPEALTHRYARAYGTRMDVFLKGKTSLESLGQHHGAGLYQAEVDYLKTHEWARGAEDILWRRTKLKLHGASLEQ
ncbi:MAG TPA: glycerol-3-phosphate dehydrogenase [Alphaproteobacteria bacterium]|nr:glycerol-3-phosphate dehydrogenase [Alphaproteobacteria bacterium]